MKPNGPPAVKSASRVLDLLELVGKADEPLSFLELSRELQIPKSSLFHLLDDLTRRGYIEPTSEVARYRRYRLGSATYALARWSSVQRESLSEVVTPVLRQLGEQLNETSAYYVRRNYEVEVVATEIGRQPLTYQMLVGDTGPLYAFSAGKVALAYFSEEELKAYFASVERRRHTPKTIVDEFELRREIEEIRSSGFGHSKGELAAGVVGTARGVVVDGRLAGILNISIPEARMDETVMATVLKVLVSSTAELETLLHRAWPFTR